MISGLFGQNNIKIYLFFAFRRCIPSYKHTIHLSLPRAFSPNRVNINGDAKEGLHEICSSWKYHCYCLFVIYLLERVEVLAAIKLMWTCHTHPYNHKGQPQHLELHALVKVINSKSSVKGAPAISNPKMNFLLKRIP